MSWTDRRIFAENLSIIICPDEAGDNSSFFVEGARNYLTGIILYLLHLNDEEKLDEPLSFPYIIDRILATNVFDITLAIKDCGNTIPGEYTNSFIGSNDKNCAGIWSHLCKCIRPFNTGALRVLFDGKGDCISAHDGRAGAPGGQIRERPGPAVCGCGYPADVCTGTMPADLPYDLHL